MKTPTPFVVLRFDIADDDEWPVCERCGKRVTPEEAMRGGTGPAGEPICEECMSAIGSH